jgi:hypothetical protein
LYKEDVDPEGEGKKVSLIGKGSVGVALAVCGLHCSNCEGSATLPSKNFSSSASSSSFSTICSVEDPRFDTCGRPWKVGFRKAISFSYFHGFTTVVSCSLLVFFFKMALR